MKRIVLIGSATAGLLAAFFNLSESLVAIRTVPAVIENVKRESSIDALPLRASLPLAAPTSTLTMVEAPGPTQATATHANDLATLREEPELSPDDSLSELLEHEFVEVSNRWSETRDGAYSALGLDDEEVQRLTELRENYSRHFESLRLEFEASKDPDTSASIHQAIRESAAEFDSRVRESLGDSRFSQLVEIRDAFNSRLEGETKLRPRIESHW